MKYRISLVILIAVAFGFMLWGCSSQTQDPVSSVNSVRSTGPQILHKTQPAPTNVLAVVNGLTVTISWDPLAGADSFEVAITLNGNPWLNVYQTGTQLTVPNLPFGSYSVSVAGMFGGTPGNVTTVVFTLGTLTNVVAVVNGTTATISWSTVALADSYHVAITLNGNSYLNVKQKAVNLVVPNLPPGNYSVTVAAIQSGLPEGPASTPVSFIVLSSVAAPTVTAIASPVPFWFRNGEWVTVTFSGMVVNTQGGASYELKDEYNMIHYTGTVPAGPYAVKLKLKDRSIWFDRDGRQYTFTITATNSAGTAKASVTVTVPRDRNCPDQRDDDGWDGHR